MSRRIEKEYILLHSEIILTAVNFTSPEPTNPNTCIRDIMEEHEVSVKYYLSTVYIETLKRHKARHEQKGMALGMK